MAFSLISWFILPSSSSHLFESNSQSLIPSKARTSSIRLSRMSVYHLSCFKSLNFKFTTVTARFSSYFSLDWIISTWEVSQEARLLSLLFRIYKWAASHKLPQPSSPKQRPPTKPLLPNLVFRRVCIPSMDQ